MGSTSPPQAAEAAAVPEAAAARGRWPLVLASIVAAAAVIAAHRTFDTDLPWHLAIGRLAVQERSTLPVDVFSYSAQGAPWVYKDLLADLILYAGFPALGYLWLALLKGAAALSLAGAAYLILPPPERGPLRVLLGAGLLLLAVQHRLTERPLLFSLACFPLLLSLCDRARRLVHVQAGGPGEGPKEAIGGAGLRSAFLPIVCLQWLWMLLHREAMLGLVVLAGLFLYLLGTAAAHRLGLRLSMSRLLLAEGPPARGAVAGALLTLCAALGLGLLTPSGAQLYRTTFTLTGSEVLMELLAEWRRYPVPEMARIFPAATLVSGLGALALVVALSRTIRDRRRPAVLDAWYFIWWALFAAQALKTVRYLPALATVSALIAARLCAASLPGRRRAPAWLLPVGCAALPGLLALTNPYQAGLGEQADQYPQGALAYAARHGLRERVVNASGFGGYVIWHGWPRFKVLIDGRTDTVYAPSFVLRCARAQREAAAFAAMRAEDGADWVLASNREGRETHTFLAEDPAWALVYYSEAAVIYVRRDAYPQLAAGALRHIRPAGVVTGVVRAIEAARGEERALAGIRAELEGLVAASPGSARLLVALAVFHHLRGPAAWGARDEVVRGLRARHPDHPKVREALQAMNLAP
jgi:hypothetical protein